MTWRVPASMRTRESLSDLIEGRLSSADGRAALVKLATRLIVEEALEAESRARGLLQSSALCTMGCAVPLAIGRKLAEPERAVVATVGDAGLEMFLGELATVRDLKLAIPIVVFVDTQLGLIEMKQRSSQLPALAVNFGATDFPAVAEALGGEGVSQFGLEMINTLPATGGA